MEIGRNVLSMEEYILSIHYFNLAIKAKPYLAEPYYFRGLAKLMLDDFKGAEEDCTKALELNKFLTEAHRVRGYARQRLENDSMALEDFNAGLEYIPVDKYFLFYKASSQTTLGQYDAADSTFNLLTRYFPKFDASYSERARMNAAKGDTIAALAYLDTALQLNKKEPFPYMLKAEISVKQKNWSEARNNLDHAIELLPQHTDLYLNRAYVRYNDDDYFGAMSDYNYIIEMEPENVAARYNRGLLRYELRDLNASATDFSAVLEKNPDNFHARYSRALINLETGQYKAAIADFQKIATRYPKFYPVYYAMAQAYQDLGDTRRMIDNYNKAENLVRLYVANPRKNPLDKPSINPANTNTMGNESHEGESDMEVMERFNQLVTVSAEKGAASAGGYQDAGTKGKLQDRDMRIEPEPMYALSLYHNPTELNNMANYFKDLSAINNSHALPFELYLTGAPTPPEERNEIERLFDLSNSLAKAPIEKERPIDYLANGIILTLLRDYDGALAAIEKAIELKNDLTAAYMARGYLRYAIAKTKTSKATANDDILGSAEYTGALRLAMEDFNKAAELDPRLVYAWFNRAWLYYESGDYTSALECLNKAIEVNPDFGEAYFNRALTYLRLGNKAAGRHDLSKAGELGVMPSYNLLKKMQ